MEDQMISEDEDHQETNQDVVTRRLPKSVRDLQTYNEPGLKESLVDPVTTNQGRSVRPITRSQRIYYNKKNHNSGIAMNESRPNEAQQNGESQSDTVIGCVKSSISTQTDWFDNGSSTWAMVV